MAVFIIFLLHFAKFRINPPPGIKRGGWAWLLIKIKLGLGGGLLWGEGWSMGGGGGGGGGSGRLYIAHGHYNGVH